MKSVSMPQFEIDEIKQVLAGLSRPPKPRELAKAMHVGQSQYRLFRRRLNEAVARGELERIRGGRLVAPSSAGKVRGKLLVARSGVGFVVPDGGGAEIFVAEKDLGGALHGEQVLVELKRYRLGKSREGRVVKVLNRGGSQIVGRLEKTRHGWRLKPYDPRVDTNIEVDNPRNLPLKPDYLAVAVLGDWQAEYLSPVGHITEILGPAGSPSVDIDALVRAAGVPTEFSPGTLLETEKIRRTIPTSEIKRRVDLRSKVVFTIDPADAKDHDDAIGLEEEPDGTVCLGVHIADVSYYVKAKSDLDREALLRGNSIYLVDRVIPMLPEKLSGDLCSLMEGADRLTVSVLAYLDKNAKVVRSEIVESVICSRASLSYEEAQSCLDGRPSARLRPYAEVLAKMNELARKLRANRLKAGSLDFDLPEPKVVLDREGNVIDIFRYPRYESHRLIEEFMLVANCVVAKAMQAIAAPILYRVHERPDKLKVQNFAELLAEMGYDFGFKGEITAKKLQRVLDFFAGRKEEQFIHRLLLRSLAKAAYQPHNIGHFALAFPTYTHFTSPIRRYPDLHLHRVLKLHLQGRLDSETAMMLRQGLEMTGRHCSETEIIADELERESVKIKLLDYFADKIGSVMTGTISGVTKAGLFVEIDDLLAEGFLPYSSFADDFYVYDENRHQAIGRRRKRRYRLGDTIEVLVVKVDRENRQIIFSPASLIARTKR